MLFLAPLAGVLIGLGIGLVVLGHFARRTHSERFKQHTKRLKAADTDDEVGREFERFSNDPVLDWCIRAMEVEQYGLLLLVVGAALFAVAWE